MGARMMTFLGVVGMPSTNPLKPKGSRVPRYGDASFRSCVSTSVLGPLFVLSHPKGHCNLDSLRNIKTRDHAGELHIYNEMALPPRRRRRNLSDTSETAQ